MQYRTIEIDIDVHKLIEAERRNFLERPNDALRRMLGLGEAAKASPPRASSRSWVADGVTLPHGTLLRMTYNKRTYEGEVVDGQWMLEGRSFGSPSGAASALAVTKRGAKTKLDGWTYWYARRPGDDAWVRLDTLRSAKTATSKTAEELGP